MTLQRFGVFKGSTVSSRCTVLLVMVSVTDWKTLLLGEPF